MYVDMASNRHRNRHRRANRFDDLIPQWVKTRYRNRCYIYAAEDQYEIPGDGIAIINKKNPLDDALTVRLTSPLKDFDVVVLNATGEELTVVYGIKDSKPKTVCIADKLCRAFMCRKPDKWTLVPELLTSDNV